MACRKCSKEPVILVSGNRMCRRHFIHYFERRVLNTIRMYGLLKGSRNIGVACSGGKDSLSVLSMVNGIAKRNRRMRVTALAIDEGIGGYREHTLRDLKRFCKGKKIPLKIFSFKGEFGFTLDQAVESTCEKPCSLCGVLRRYLLNRKARELGFDLLITGHNLDDEVQSILMNQFRRNIQALARMGPCPGIIKNRAFIKRIKPLYFVSERETTAYAFLTRILGGYTECPYSRTSFRNTIRAFINNVEAKHPGAKHGIVNSLLEMLPVLNKAYRGRTVGLCEKCGEVSSDGECRACKILNGVYPKLKGD